MTSAPSSAALYQTHHDITGPSHPALAPVDDIETLGSRHAPDPADRDQGLRLAALRPAAAAAAAAFPSSSPLSQHNRHASLTHISPTAPTAAAASEETADHKDNNHDHDHEHDSSSSRPTTATAPSPPPPSKHPAFQYSTSLHSPSRDIFAGAPHPDDGGSDDPRAPRDQHPRPRHAAHAPSALHLHTDLSSSPVSARGIGSYPRQPLQPALGSAAAAAPAIDQHRSPYQTSPELQHAYERAAYYNTGAYHSFVSGQDSSTLPVRTSSVKSLASARSLSPVPSSVASSPGVGPLAEITPLPSPIGGSPDPWSRLSGGGGGGGGGPGSRTGSRPSSSAGNAPFPTIAAATPLPPPAYAAGAVAAAASASLSPSSSLRKRKAYSGLVTMPETQEHSSLASIDAAHANADAGVLPSSSSAHHTRGRSNSEYVPPSSQSSGQQQHYNRPRKSTAHTPTSLHPPTGPAGPMHREEHLAVQRGISALPTPIVANPPLPLTVTPSSSAASKVGLSAPSDSAASLTTPASTTTGRPPPTPPASNRGASPPTSPELRSTSSSSLLPQQQQQQQQSQRIATANSATTTAAPSIPGSVPTHYEARLLRSGKLCRWAAVRQLGMGTFSRVMLATGELERAAGSGWPEERLDRRQLVAVKICDHGPKGGADERKIESSLQRELEILKSIEHPSLVALKGVSLSDKRALLILGYCPGGDLFELASAKLEVLGPGLIRRIFAELVDAVAYLHERFIVHRDIKLENVLVNVPLPLLSSIPDYQTHPHPLITLTDLGLGRSIPKPPASPMLNTRCGSEDYAAPELLMGQEYDGRATDLWALGVLLYALIEGRLPFDPPLFIRPAGGAGAAGAAAAAASQRRKPSPTSHRIARCEWRWWRFTAAAAVGGAAGDLDDEDWVLDDEQLLDRTANPRLARMARDLQGAKLVVEGLLRRARSRWALDRLRKSDWILGGVDVPGGLKVAAGAGGDGSEGGDADGDDNDDVADEEMD